MHIVDIKQQEIIDGFTGRFVHTKGFTIGFWEVEAGAELPQHAHIHEQTTQVTEGEFEMTVSGVTKIYKPGMILVIPSNSTHGGKALTNCKITDIFCSERLLCS